MKKIFLFSLLSLFLISCSSKKESSLLPWEQGRAVKLTEIRPANENASKIKIRISAKEYARALAEGGNKNTARLVEVYNNSKYDPTTPPEYRVFDVQRGGVWDLLHLATADVIVAAGGYVIPNQQIFFQYLNLMKDLGGGSLQVIRSGRTFDITYVIQD